MAETTGDRSGSGSEAPLAAGAAFDAHHPPSAGRIDDCVHCGFCLPTCPTYALWGEEMDSPRGRIYLMKLGREGAVPMGDTLVGHMDACLGCMACVTACPSGVRYDELIEATRAQIERNYTRTRGDRAFRWLVFALFPHPGRLRIAAVAAWLYQQLRLRALLARLGVLERLPARLGALEGLLPPVSLRGLTQQVPERTPAVGPRRLRVGLLTGCVQRVFFGDVNAATVRVLAAEGCEVLAPRQQGCCGALMVHAGVEGDALARARALIDAFEEAHVDVLVTNAAGCGSTVKEYAHLLRDDPEYGERARTLAAKARDVTELLHELAPRATRAPIRARVAYHDACHLTHAQGVRSAPREQLRSIPGLEVTDIAEPDLCCGSAGVYNLLQPEPAADLGRRKAEAVARTAPDALVTANPGCTLQIRRYLEEGVPTFHPVELVDAAIRGITPASLAARDRDAARGRAAGLAGR